MFPRARLRLTAIYTLLLGLTLLLVVGVIAVLAMNDARRSDDLELRLRVESVAQHLAQAPGDVPAAGLQVTDEPEPDRDDAGNADHDLEAEGILTFVLPLGAGGAPVAPAGGVTGLPSVPAAMAAFDANGGRYATRTLAGGRVRLFSEPVVAGGRTVAVVQAARSRYFVESTLRRLVLIALGAGLLGLALSAGAGFWLAGLTLQPIAAALQRQRAFTSDASHELRTPLAVVRGNAEILAKHRERTIGEYEEVVQDIVDESERLTRLVGDMLALARADEGRDALVPAEVDLSQVAADAARHFEQRAAQRSLTLKTEIEAGVVVRGERDRLLQLVGILLENAVRYTVEGAIVVRVARRQREAMLAVQDTGPGIARPHLAHLFERFYRADRARATGTGGSGLGLAIAQRIATLHHGRLTVGSELGRGSTFTLHLPLGG